MSRELPTNSSLEGLRKEAKRWLKSIEAGDATAIAGFSAALPGRTSPGLRDVQQALAREYGFTHWAALKQEIEDRARGHAQRVELFLEKGVHRYGTDPRTRKWGAYERDGANRGALAAGMLARHPEIARETIHTAVLAHDLNAVEDMLAKNSALANQACSLDGRPPLMYLAFARLPLPAVAANALPIAVMLLDNGADVSGHLQGYSSSFTALTGVIGEGEGEQSPHPQSVEFSRLLIERGADPLDGQALYNTSLGADSVFWLDLLWSESKKRGDDVVRWHTAIPDTLGPPLEYLLGNAVNNGHERRVAWLLEHGADATANDFYSKQPVIMRAAASGRQDLIDLLVRHGAKPPVLSEAERCIAAALNGDRDAIRRLATAQPDLLRHPDAMFAAIRTDNADLAKFLLDLGMSPDVGDDKNFRALHFTTHCGAQKVAKLLIARGAEIDPFEQTFGGTPLSHANYHRRQEMIAILASVSRNVRGLCFAGCIERMRELLTEDASISSADIHEHEPPLFCLPDDDDRASELADLLLSFGASPKARNAAGLTPAEAARKRGLDDAAALLEAAMGSG